MKHSIFITTFFFFSFFQINAQNNLDKNFFDSVDQFFKEFVDAGAVDYKNLQNNSALDYLVQTIEATDLTRLDAKTVQAFYINAYNIFVIKGITDNYPINSVLDIKDFFDTKKWKIAGENISLNQLEKEQLLGTFKDARFHFVLVCGAKDCPPITNFAYLPKKLEEQLNQQAELALNNPSFIRVDETNQAVNLSQIFNWYESDFGGNRKTAVEYINQFRKESIPATYKIDFYEYDWSLNEQNSPSDIKYTDLSNNANRYVVSAAIPKGSTETKWFNNLYTQRTGTGESLTERATFFTSSLSFLYGVNNRFNAGFDLRYRRVNYSQLPASSVAVFGDTDRQGITNFGPKIRWAPIKKWSNFSIQSAFWIPVGKNLQGNEELPYIDWDGATWITQLFNDFDLGNKFSVFTELDFTLEDIGKTEEGDLNRFSTPATVIFSYFPNPKTTIYALSNFAPYWQSDFDYFAQAGIGAKYQVTSSFEIELLYTGFTNKFLQQIEGKASTFNIGFRFSR